MKACLPGLGCGTAMRGTDSGPLPTYSDRKWMTKPLGGQRKTLTLWWGGVLSPDELENHHVQVGEWTCQTSKREPEE